MRVTGTSGTTSVPTRGAREKRARRRAAGAIQGCRSQSRRPTVSLVRMTMLASGITFDGVCFTCFRDWHGTPAARSRSLKSARLREESVSLRSACKRRKPFVLRATDNRSRNASHMVRIVGRLEVANLASRLDYATPIGPYGDIVAGLASAGLPVAGRHGPAKRAPEPLCGEGQSRAWLGTLLERTDVGFDPQTRNRTCLATVDLSGSVASRTGHFGRSRGVEPRFGTEGGLSLSTVRGPLRKMWLSRRLVGLGGHKEVMQPRMSI